MTFIWHGMAPESGRGGAACGLGIGRGGGLGIDGDSRMSEPTSGGIGAAAWRGGVDRRRARRAPADLGIKVLRPSLARYFAGRTEDVSAGGALISVRTSRPIAEGEDVAVGVCWDGGALLRADELATATVVRAEPLAGGRQRLAVRFARAQADGARLAEADAAAA